MRAEEEARQNEAKNKEYCNKATQIAAVLGLPFWFVCWLLSCWMMIKKVGVSAMALLSSIGSNITYTYNTVVRNPYNTICSGANYTIHTIGSGATYAYNAIGSGVSSFFHYTHCFVVVAAYIGTIGTAYTAYTYRNEIRNIGMKTYYSISY